MVGSAVSLDFSLAGSAVSLDDSALPRSTFGPGDFLLPTIEPRFLRRLSRSLATTSTKLSEVLNNNVKALNVDSTLCLCM